MELFDYLGQRGDQTVCAIPVETRSAIDNIEEIRKVEGVDCLTIAPFDLSTELGVCGRLDAPELVEATTAMVELHAGRVEYRPDRRGPAGMLLHAGHMRAGPGLGEEPCAALDYTSWCHRTPDTAAPRHLRGRGARVACGPNRAGWAA